MKKVGISILGLGVAGGGVYEILSQNREFYRETQEVDLSVESVLEINRERAIRRANELGIPEEKIAEQIAEVVSNPDVNVVVECIGGVELAREYVLAALNAGKTVVSSNKELISLYSHELERAAKRQNAGLYFEASCAGGVPIIRTLLDGVQSNRISLLMGIVNSTTNYILTKMTEEGLSYGEALKEAQIQGFAEADPTNDVNGLDAAYELSILASLAFHMKVPPVNIFREGISGVSCEDIAEGKELGYVLKFLAIGHREGNDIEVRVHPTFLKKRHPLSSASHSFNAVFMEGDAIGEVMLYGKGAGAKPTASAVVSDILYAATHAESKPAFNNTEIADKGMQFVTDFKSAYYLRCTVSDEAGVLAKITSILGKNNISLLEVKQKKTADGKISLVLITHETHELAVQNAVSKINALETACVEQVIRVAN